MKIIDYSVIERNIKKLNKNTILVVKDNAYGCNLFKVLDIAYKNGFTFFAVKEPLDALKISMKYNDVHVLILGKRKIVSKRNVFLTVEDESDYLFAKKNNMPFHLKVKSMMNRFGTNEVDKYASDDLCKGLYYHIGFSKNTKVIKEIENFKRIILKYNYKILHIGGSICLNYDDKLIKRVGMSIYDNSIFLEGRVIKIILIKPFSYLGYKKNIMNCKSKKIAIIDVGYSSGLLRRNKNAHVFINGKRYKLVGYKCMDYSYAIIDENVSLNDKVEFIGNNITIDEVASYERRTKYELLVNIK